MTLGCAPGQVTLTIIDDGVGFGYDAVQSDPRRGIGLRNMRERVESLNGVFVIQSRQGGTELKAVIPVDLPTIASGRART